MHYKVKLLIQPLLSASLIATSLFTMNISFAAPQAKLDFSLSAHSQNKIKQLLNDPKTWQQIPKQVTLCVFSPNGEHSEAFEQATQYITEIPKMVRVAKQLGVNMNVTRPSHLQFKLDFEYPKLKKSVNSHQNSRHT